MPTPSEPVALLTDWYAGAVTRGGHRYPVSVASLSGSCDDVVVRLDGDLAIDVGAAALGTAHLERLRAGAQRELFDGRLLGFDSVRDGRLLCRGTSYFAMLATCDAARAELIEAASPAALDDLPIRRRLHEAAGDPLATGSGRGAAVGATVVTTVPKGTARSFLLGQRSGDNALDVGMWHLAPSGMLDDVGVGSLAATVAAELKEELGVVLTRDEVAARVQVLGIAHDLLRLRPDICLRLDLTEAESPAVGDRTGEFAQVRAVELSDAGLTEFWQEHSAATLTPAAAGAVAILENSLQHRVDRSDGRS